MMLAESDIKAMSPVERLQAMELLWRSFSSPSKEMQSPEWHGEVLSERLAKVNAGKGTFLTLADLKTRLASRQS